MADFEVVFQGQVQPGLDPAQVRARIGQLFQVDERQVGILFSGRRVVIKSGLDEQTAQRYRQAIERAGARCEIVPLKADPVAAARAVAPRDEFMAAFADVQAPDFPLAEPGADMQDSYQEHAPLNIDLSALSLAPPGADLGQQPDPSPPPAPDTSHLRLQD